MLYKSFMSCYFHLLLDCLRVSNDCQRPLRPRHGNIQPSFLAQETDFAFVVAADKANDNCLLLSSLESVHTAELDTGKLVL